MEGRLDFASIQQARLWRLRMSMSIVGPFCVKVKGDPMELKARSLPDAIPNSLTEYAPCTHGHGNPRKHKKS